MISTKNNPTVHQLAGMDVGGPGECAAWCTCDLEFAGFDTAEDATAHIDRHIADEERRGRLLTAWRPARKSTRQQLRALWKRRAKNKVGRVSRRVNRKRGA